MNAPRQPETIALGAGKEFDAIRVMMARWGPAARGIGDDAAVLAVPRGERLVASVDAAIEGHHFQKEWLTAREIGYRAATAALSDLAAMGAQPLGILVALSLPARWIPTVADLADGIGDAVGVAGTCILGGNTSAGETLSITTTVLGSVYAPLQRCAVRSGDTLYVTGRLGGPGAAVAAWRRGETPSAEHRERFARPRARIREARWLADRGATSAIDVSDGLAADLQHLAAASGVGIDVDLALLPLVSKIADADAAASGEEFELVVGAASPLSSSEFEAAFGVPLTVIARATSAHEGVHIHRGRDRVANPGGYDHLSS